MADIVETRIEDAGHNRIRIVTMIDLGTSSADQHSEEPIGEGPTGDAIPDKIVRYLIDRSPEDARLSEIQDVVGGNPGTVNRQAWTLANNAPDLQRRLVGWVQSPGRGRYELTPRARELIAGREELSSE